MKAAQTRSLTYSFLNMGIELEYWQSLSYLLSTAQAGSDKIRLGYKMARHKHFQSLGEVTTQT